MARCVCSKEETPAPAALAENAENVEEATDAAEAAAEEAAAAAAAEAARASAAGGGGRDAVIVADEVEALRVKAASEEGEERGGSGAPMEEANADAGTAPSITATTAASASLVVAAPTSTGVTMGTSSFDTGIEKRDKCGAQRGLESILVEQQGRGGEKRNGKKWNKRKTRPSL